MRVLVVSNLYPPTARGGYELTCESFVGSLRRAGDEVLVLTGAHVDPAGPGVARRLPSYIGLGDEVLPKDPLRRLSTELRSAAVLRRALRGRPDVVVWFNLGGLAVSLPARARRAGVPSVMVVSDEWPLWGAAADLWRRMITGAVPLRVAARALRMPVQEPLEDVGPWVFVSETLRSRLASAGVVPAEADVIGAGVQVERYRRRPEGPWRGRLLCAGRVVPEKGVDLAVRALAELPHGTQLTIVGEGPEGYRAQLGRLAEQLGVAGRVHMLGGRDAEAMRAIYADHDAFLFPIRWEEPYGMAPLEAMSSDVPVIAVARGGTAELLRDGRDSLIVPPEDPHALATAVRRLAEDGVLRRRLVDGGRRTAHGQDRAVGEARLRALVARVAGQS